VYPSVCCAMLTPRFACTASQSPAVCSVFFFFNDTATTEIYTLSLHDALPICFLEGADDAAPGDEVRRLAGDLRSEEHTSELQSLTNLVCRLLLEKKKKLK